MNVPSQIARFVAAFFWFTVPPAGAADPGAAAASSATAYAPRSALVATATPAVQDGASAPVDAAAEATTPVPPAAVDWRFTPRRSFHARRR